LWWAWAIDKHYCDVFWLLSFIVFPSVRFFIVCFVVFKVLCVSWWYSGVWCEVWEQYLFDLIVVLKFQIIWNSMKYSAVQCGCVLMWVFVD
jgi:hypothetical protein